MFIAPKECSIRSRIKEPNLIQRPVGTSTVRGVVDAGDKVYNSMPLNKDRNKACLQVTKKPWLNHGIPKGAESMTVPNCRDRSFLFVSTK